MSDDQTPRPDQRPASVAASSPVVIARHSDGPPFLVRALWFVFIGWWLTGLVNVLAYLIALTIIGLPLAFMIFNRLPTVLTLRPRTVHTTHEVSGGVTHITETRRPAARLLRPRRLLRLDRLVVRRDLVGAGLAALHHRDRHPRRRDDVQPAARRDDAPPLLGSRVRRSSWRGRAAGDHGGWPPANGIVSTRPKGLMVPPQPMAARIVVPSRESPCAKRSPTKPVRSLASPVETFTE